MTKKLATFCLLGAMMAAVAGCSTTEKTIAGAAAGGVGGAVAGNAIGGSGGALVGGIAGAAAGGLIARRL
ncbi:hypothetical protein [Chelativorans intermedius]|uniref:YMGG-like Gly-zipper domain-containing protein n=1 Tax=Chelativorans intermedius TaxID=515947 RepID=A0ABV6D916_9HYPH|nr:hypothetical protein [Chelativorans intermedius]MCT8998729.1 hypothetical protein [Chelativorans intermedius]